MVDLVHSSWTTRGLVPLGPPDGVDWRPPLRGGMLTGAWPPAALELRSSSVRVGRGEGRTVKPVRCSPGLERRRDGQAMMANRRWQGARRWCCSSLERREGEQGWVR
jgi:hypothetical protein